MLEIARSAANSGVAGHSGNRCARSTLSGLLLASCLAALPCAVLAADETAAEAAGEISAADVAALAENQPDLQNDIPGRSTRLEDYQAAIARLESEQGAWGNGLAEQLSGLGETYQVRGLHRDAIEIFDRAIHISRINNGLYDLTQVPIIESLLESLKARGHWEEVHDRHQYLYWLHKRNYGAEDPRMLPVIEKLGKWYINDYALNPDRRVMDQLVDAHDLFEHAVNIVTGTYGQLDLRLIEPLRGLVMSNWFFANYRGENQLAAIHREELSREVHPTQLGFAQDRQPNQLMRYMRNNYADGKQAIQQMVDIYGSSPDAPPGAAAQAKVELGDWEQLWERHQTAATLYREAYRELSADEATRSQAKQVFGQPVALPDMDLVEADVEQSSGGSNESAEPAHYVLVSFDVNRFGQAERIDVLEARPEGNNGYQSRVRRTLESTKFRPRLVDGKPVATKGLTQKYVFNDD